MTVFGMLLAFADRTWECFVRSVETAHLGPLLSHVIVALLPLIPLQPKETAAIIRFLILENRLAIRYREFTYMVSTSVIQCRVSHREEVNDYLHEIYFLPDHPELKDIHTVLQNFKKVRLTVLVGIIQHKYDSNTWRLLVSYLHRFFFFGPLTRTIIQL